MANISKPLRKVFLNEIPEHRIVVGRKHVPYRYDSWITVLIWKVNDYYCASLFLLLAAVNVQELSNLQDSPFLQLTDHLMGI